MNQELSDQWAHHEEQPQKENPFKQYEKSYTLKMVWEGQGLRSSQVAARSDISVTTLYKMNRKDTSVSMLSILAVCKTLDISVDMFHTLVAETEPHLYLSPAEERRIDEAMHQVDEAE